MCDPPAEYVTEIGRTIIMVYIRSATAKFCGSDYLDYLFVYKRVPFWKLYLLSLHRSPEPPPAPTVTQTWTIRMEKTRVGTRVYQNKRDPRTA